MPIEGMLQATSEILKRGAIRSTLNVMGSVGIGSPAGENGAGLVMTLHRVEPQTKTPFQPNAHLTITPEFLETVIITAKDQGMVPIALCDAPEYIAQGHSEPFIAFTLDDGYLNNSDFAAPIFQKHGVPYTIFVSKGLSERTHTMWWETAAKLIGTVDEFALSLNGTTHKYSCDTHTKKHQAFKEFAQLLLDNDEDEAVQALNAEASNHAISAHELTSDLVMSAEELVELDQDPLCHLAPHTVSHINLACATPERLAIEISESISYVEKLTGETPSSHVFSYPYGKPFATRQAVFDAAQQAGIKVGVTTQAGSVEVDCSNADWLHIPRMSINGYYQTKAAATALLCGVPTLLAKRNNRKNLVA